MAHGTLFLYPGGVMSPRPPWHLSPALRGFHCPHPSRGVPSSGSQGHHPCPPWGVPVTSRVSPAAPQSQGVSSLWSPGTLSLSPWGLSLLPRGLRCSHPPWDIVPVPPGVPHCLQRFPIPPQSVPVPQGCPILRARGTLSPSLPPGLSLSTQGCPYPLRGVPVPMELLSPIQISSSPPSHRDHRPRSGGGARTGRGHPWGRGSDLMGVAKGGAPACGARLHARPRRPAQRHFRFLPAGSAASLAAMASRLLRVSAALRLLPAASARAVPARNLGVPGERGRGKRGNGGGVGEERAGPGRDGGGVSAPPV